MKERPILFSGPMVRALLDGRKTQTRRLMKPPPTYVVPGVGTPCFVPDGGLGKEIVCPYGVPGDRLWVRETWRAVMTEWSAFVEFAAGGPDLNGVSRDVVKAPLALRFPGRDDARHSEAWRPSIFMPRWASRLTLEVTEVRVEHLQDISEEDAKAEGIERSKGGQWLDYESDGKGCVYNPKHGFQSLWDSINGKGAWAYNPWVWALTFKRVLPST